MVRAHLLGCLASLTLVAGCRTAGRSVVQQSRAWPAMGTVFTATAWGHDSGALDRALEAAFDSVRLVDSLLSTYRPQSEISRINRGKGKGEGGKVSATFAAVLSEALRVARASQGAFDPTLRDWRGIHVDSAARRVRLEPGLALDFGGIAKGYALDRAAAALGGVADSGVLNLGGQLLFLGRPGAVRGGMRRSVGVIDPGNPERALAVIEVDSGSVSTSSQAERPGHIVDPRTGGSAARARSVTVVAPTGIAADAWSTAFFVLGCDSALALAAAQRVELVCVDRAVRWSAGLDGRVALATESAAGPAAPSGASAPRCPPPPPPPPLRAPPRASGRRITFGPSAPRCGPAGETAQDGTVPAPRTAPTTGGCARCTRGATRRGWRPSRARRRQREGVAR